MSRISAATQSMARIKEAAALRGAYRKSMRKTHKRRLFPKPAPKYTDRSNHHIYNHLGGKRKIRHVAHGAAVIVFERDRAAAAEILMRVSIGLPEKPGPMHD